MSDDAKQSAIDLLKAAREVIASPDTWTTGHLAVTKSGTSCAPNDDAAVKWCMLGALNKVYIDPPSRSLAMTTLLDLMDTRILSDFNDRHTHAEVLDVCDKAIAKLQESLSNG